MDAIYILDVRPKGNKKFIEYVGDEMKEYFIVRKAYFSINQIHINHCSELHYDTVPSWEKSTKGHRPSIRSIGSDNNVNFSNREISDFLRAQLPKDELEKRLKERYDRGEMKRRHRHNDEVTEWTEHIFSKSGCKEMLARELGIYETEKKPTWSIEFLARKPSRQVNEFVDFLKSVEIGEPGFLDDFSKFYVETYIHSVFKRIL
jgi:hypothetical protein